MKREDKLEIIMIKIDIKIGIDQTVVMLPTMWTDILPHYDPYVFPQVWADIPLKGVVTIP